MLEINLYPATIPTADYFCKVEKISKIDEQFKEGQKLEAVDPLEMSR
ncbi:unnamed protein product, partial [Rotaria socialis]